jgi:hypothetical protein
VSKRDDSTGEKHGEDKRPGSKERCKEGFLVPSQIRKQHHDLTNSPLYFLPLILVFTRWSTARDRETTQPWEEELAGKASSGCGDNVQWCCII